ncbi:MAG: hypothetical protein DHS20C12_04370 [Pseudohongiella sp.]|nr:MAG: hypothetical protein DHS20C12_04370 [Pseudohongiella sp.]
MLVAESLIAACAGIDTILHLAGEAHVGNVSNDSEGQSIVLAAENLLAAASEQGVSRIVFVSSSLAAAAETHSRDMTSYGSSKLQAETAFLKACERGDIEVAILRPVNVYGVGMKGNIAGMISLVSKGRLPPLPRIGSRISLVGVRDLARAIILAANLPAASARIYTITDGQEYGLNEIENAIYRALGRTKPSWHTPAVILYIASVVAGAFNKMGISRSSISGRTYQNLMNDNLFDNSKACQELGFSPSETLYEALPEITEHILRTGSKAN